MDEDNNTQKDSNKIKEARWYEIFVYVNNVLSNPKEPIPIGINNSLPSISFYLVFSKTRKTKCVYL